MSIQTGWAGLTLRGMTWFLSTLYMAFALLFIRAAFHGHVAFGLGGLIFWVSLATGLGLRLKVCRVVALGTHFSLMLVIPFAVLGKWGGLDSMPMNPQPPLWLMCVCVVAIGIVNCLIIFTLYKRKNEFGPPPHHPTSSESA